VAFIDIGRRVILSRVGHCVVLRCSWRGCRISWRRGRCWLNRCGSCIGQAPATSSIILKNGMLLLSSNYYSLLLLIIN